MKPTIATTIVTLCATVLIGIANADMNKTAPALKTPAGSAAASHNSEGIEHYDKGHWDVAKKHFTEAVKADASAAEAHYNLVLALDKMGDHKAAIEHFKKAQELGKDNTEIQHSEILQAHLKAKH